MADNLEALYAQFLAGGTPRVINPVQVQGPNISPMGFADMGGGGGGASGFASLADGILGYLDKRKKEKEAAAGTGVSDAPPPANTFGGGGSQYQGHPPPAPAPRYEDDERGTQYPDDIITTTLPPMGNPFGGGGSQYRPQPAPTPTPKTSHLTPEQQAAWEEDETRKRIDAYLTMNGFPPSF